MKKWLETDSFEEAFNKFNDNVGEIEQKLTEPLILENLIVNGDFSDGTNGWSTFYSVNTVNDGILNNTGDGTNAVPRTYATAFSRIGGHQYYVKVRWRVTNSQCTRLYITGFGISYGVDVPVENVWYDTKTIMSSTTSSDTAFVQLHQSYSDTTMANGKVMQIENVLVTDLTETFGAGNEPTKEQMDELMKVVPNGWWDGELTLEQKEVVQWLLKLESEKVNKAYKVNPTSPTLLNNFRVGLQGCIYYQNDDGTVCVQGAVASDSVVLGSTIFQFPVGLRPLKTLVFNGVRTDNPDAVIYVTPSGEVKYMRGGSNESLLTWASLSQIRFKAGV